MASGHGHLGLIDQGDGELRPGSLPAVAIANGDLLGDGQALADVGHARIGFANASLELAIEGLVVKVELHVGSLFGFDGFRTSVITSHSTVVIPVRMLTILGCTRRPASQVQFFQAVALRVVKDPGAPIPTWPVMTTVPAFMVRVPD